MNARFLKIASRGLLAIALYWTVTAALIENSTRYLSTPHGCCVFIPFDHTGFLLWMGGRSLPSIRRRIADPKASMAGRVHLAWLAGRMGDTSQFPIFLKALHSKNVSVQSLAETRMSDFPDQCLRNLPVILAAGAASRPVSFSNLFSYMAVRANLSEEKRMMLSDILIPDEQTGRPLSRRDAATIQALFQSA